VSISAISKKRKKEKNGQCFEHAVVEEREHFRYIKKRNKETKEQQIFSDLNTPLWRSVSLSAISKKRSEKKRNKYSVI
jgi:hypothetical protein